MASVLLFSFGNIKKMVHLFAKVFEHDLHFSGIKILDYKIFEN